MTARDFCFWLQGYFELRPGEHEISAHQVETIRKHLYLVFAHEIDPKMGNSEHQDLLNKIHQNKIKPEDTLVRC
jgi:hypothetical protein